MKKFKIVYQNQNIKLNTMIDAHSIDDLKRNNKLPQNIISIKEIKQFRIGFFERSKSINCIELFNELDIMLQAKLSLSESLEILKDGYKDNSLEKEFINSMLISIENGVLISEGLEQYKMYIPSVVIKFIRLGETSSDLNYAIHALSQILNEENFYKKKILEALIYPFVLLVSILMAFFMLFYYVVPKFEGMFSKLGADLPTVTEVLLDLKEFLSNYGLAILLLIIISFLTFSMLYRLNNNFKYKIDKILLDLVPLVSGLVITLNLFKFFMVLKQLTFIKYKFPVALQNTMIIIENKYFKKKVQFILYCLEKGDDISFAFDKSGIFEPLCIRLLSSGEKSDSMNLVLEKLEVIYKTRLDKNIKYFVNTLNYVLIGLLSIMVLFMMLAIFLPIWQMGTVIN